MTGGWEGKQTLVVLHLRAQGLEEGDEQLPTLASGARLTLPLPLCNAVYALE